AIETSVKHDGSMSFMMFIPYRKERGLIEDTVVTFHGEPNTPTYGFSMEFKGGDGVVEVLGNRSNPIPIEVYQQAVSDSGLTIVNLDEKGNVVNGQLLWIDEPQTKPKVSAGQKP